MINWRPSRPPTIPRHPPPPCCRPLPCPRPATHTKNA